MNALRASQPEFPTPPTASLRAHPQRSPRRKRRAAPAARQLTTELGVEATLKLGVNLLMMVAACSALIKLFPYHQTQQEKLAQAQAELAKTEQYLASARADFSRYFDPQQAESVMREQTNRMSPHQRRIVWVNPDQNSAP